MTRTPYASNRPSGVEDRWEGDPCSATSKATFSLVKQSSVTGDVWWNLASSSTHHHHRSFVDEMEDRPVTVECCETIALRLAQRVRRETEGKRPGSRATAAFVMLAYWQQGRYRRKREGTGAGPEHQQVSGIASNAPNKNQAPSACKLPAPSNTPCSWAACYMIPRTACILYPALVICESVSPQTS